MSATAHAPQPTTAPGTAHTLCATTMAIELHALHQEQSLWAYNPSPERDSHLEVIVACREHLPPELFAELIESFREWADLHRPEGEMGLALIGTLESAPTTGAARTPSGRKIVEVLRHNRAGLLNDPPTADAMVALRRLVTTSSVEAVTSEKHRERIGSVLLGRVRDLLGVARDEVQVVS